MRRKFHWLILNCVASMIVASILCASPNSADAEIPYEVNPLANIQRIAKNTEDYFISITADKTSVYVGEPIHVHYDVYHLTSLHNQQYDARFPDFVKVKSFEVNIKKFKKSNKILNNRSYLIEPLGDYYIIPQEAGLLRIPHASIQIPQTGEWISSPPLNVDVHPLPPSAQHIGLYNIGKFEFSQNIKNNNIRKIGENIEVEINIKSSTLSNYLKFNTEYCKSDNNFDVIIPDKPKNITTTITPDEFSSQSMWTFYFIPKKEGTLQIPNIILEAFNPEIRQLQLFKSEDYSITVNGKTPFASISATHSEADAQKKENLQPIKLVTYPRLSIFAPITVTSLLAITMLLWLMPIIIRSIKRKYNEKKAKEREFLRILESETALAIIYQKLEDLLRSKLKLGKNANHVQIIKAIQDKPSKYNNSDSIQTFLEELRKNSFAPKAQCSKELKNKISKLLATLALFLAFCLPNYASTKEYLQDDPNLKQIELDAKMAYSKGNYDEALKKFSEYRNALTKMGVIDEQPYLLYNEGLAYEEKKEFENAMAKYIHASIFAEDPLIHAKILKIRNIIEQDAYIKHEQTVFIRGYTAKYRLWKELAHADPAISVTLMAFALWLVVLCLWQRKRIPVKAFIAILCFIVLGLGIMMFVVSAIQANKKLNFAVILQSNDIKDAPHELATNIDDNNFLPGQTVQIIQKQNEWTQIERSDHKMVWIPSDHLYPLNLYLKEVKE